MRSPWTPPASPATTQVIRLLPIAFVAVWLIAFMAVWLSPLPGVAQSIDAPTSRPSADTAITGDPFLWRVEGSSRPTYLFGTIHMGISASDLPNAVAESLTESPVAFFEIDLGAVNVLALMSAAMYAEGESLRHHFDPETWTRLVEAVAPRIPEALLETYRPWFLSSVITQSLLPVTEPMDMTLFTAARHNLSDLRFFETPQQQTDMLAGIAAEAMVDQIVEWLDDPDGTALEMQQLMNHYRSGAAEAVAALVLEPQEIAEWPDMYDVLIFNRNRAWMPRIVDECVRADGCFIAVGLGHILGPGGIAALLREQGFTVSRMRASE